MSEIQGQEIDRGEFIAFYDAIPARSIDELKTGSFGEMLEMIKDIQDHVDGYKGPLKDLIETILVPSLFSSNSQLISFLHRFNPNVPANALYSLKETEQSIFMEPVFSYVLSDKFLDLKLSDIVQSEDTEQIAKVFPLLYENLRPQLIVYFYSQLSRIGASMDVQQQVNDFLESFPFIKIDDLLADATIREIIEKNQKMIDVFQSYTFDDPDVKDMLLPLLQVSVHWTQIGDLLVSPIRERMDHFQFDYSIFDNEGIIEGIILNEEIASRKYLEIIQGNDVNILSREKYENALNEYLIDKNFVIDHEDSDLIVEEYLLRPQDYNAQMDIINLFLLNN